MKASYQQMPKDPNPGAQQPEQSDPLGATAMFLRVFDQKQPEDEKPATVEQLFASPAAPSNPARPIQPTAPAPADPVAGATGEFTRFFRDQAEKQSDPGPILGSPAGTARPAANSAPPANQAPGEFTKLFVKGGAEPAKVSNPAQGEGFTSPGPPPPSAGAKGFSAPGMSDAVSGESSFTQLFRSTPAAPQPVSQPLRPAPAAAAPEWNPVPTVPFEPSQPANSAASTDQSVTSLIASLGAASSSPVRAQDQEVVPYRVDPMPRPFAPPEPKPVQSSAADPGGVTQFIRRLADEPLVAPEPLPAAAPPAPAPAVKSGPGEFTRMISRAEVEAAAGAASAAPVAQPAAQPSPVPVVQPIAVPAAPVAMPVPPRIPAMPAAAQHVAPAPPVVAAPALPKFPVPAAPAIAAPKSKLDALVPYLLIVNTFLLLIVLLVLVFVIKAR